MEVPVVFLIVAVALTVGVYASPDINSVGIPGVKQWAKDRLDQALKEFNGTRYPSPGFWADSIVYQIQVDRFNDGDPSNNKNNIPSYQSEQQGGSNFYDISTYRHGGDLKGIKDRLDYLVDLGINTLWITPILKHNGDYHGYCLMDPTWVDPGFGTNEEFRDLVAAAHGKNIRVVMDIVINHMCDPASHYSRQPNHGACPDQLSSDYWKGTNSASAQGELYFSDNFFGPFKSQYFFSRCGADTDAEMRDQGSASVYGDFTSAMFDLDTRNWDLQEIFTLVHSWWIAYADIDGFRLDAAKHVTEDFIAYFSTMTRAFASKAGKNNFYIVGEVAADSTWQGRRLGGMFIDTNNPNNHGDVAVGHVARVRTIKDTYLANPMAPYPGLNAIYDFSASGTAHDVMLGLRAPIQIEYWYESEAYSVLTAQKTDMRISWNLMEIHDWPRFASHNPTSPGKSQVALAYDLAQYGIPIIYYGQEQGFNGKCNTESGKIQVGDGWTRVNNICGGNSDMELWRQDMWVNGWWRLGSTVGTIYQQSYIGKPSGSGSPDWKNDPFLDRSNYVYTTTRKMAHLRSSCKILREGSVQWRYMDYSSNGLVIFSRLLNLSEMVIVVNPGWSTVKIPTVTIDRSSNGAAGQKYVNLLNTAEYAVSELSGDSAKLNFRGMTVMGNSFLIFIHENNAGPWNDYLGIALCK